MKSIEFIAYCVREYDVRYTVVLDENDPIVQEILLNNNMTFEELASMDFQETRELWDTLMSLPYDQVKMDEDFAPNEERFVDFESYLSEN